MRLTFKQQFWFWAITVAVIFGMLFWLDSVLMPFLIGAAIAYFMDPVADRLERAGLSRMLATAIISLLGIVVFILAFLLLIPAIISQAIELFTALPAAFSEAHAFLTEHFPQMQDADSVLRRTLDSLGHTIQEKSLKLIETLLTSFGSLLSLIMLFIIVPAVAIYLLLDWDRMIAAIDNVMPRDHLDTIRRLASEIDQTLSGYVRGMGTVCLILGTYYSIVLIACGLNYGLFIGAFAGFVTFIPYIGATLGAILAIGMAIFQFWGDWFHIALVAILFFAGQIAEGNFITPKLVGNSIGLHPVWLIFALSVFGSLFGFVGMLAAVPIAACIGVLARFAIAQYKDSAFYDSHNVGRRPKDTTIAD